MARQVFSLKYVFTTVFGMGTGGFHTLRHQRILSSLCSPACLCLRKANTVNTGLRHAGNCTMNISFTLSSILTFLRLNSACAITDCSVRFAFASLTTAVFLNLRSVTCLPLPSQSQRRYVASLISTVLRKSPRPISISRLKMLPLLHL